MYLEIVELYVSFIPYFVFGFFSLLVTKLRKYYIIFVYISQGKMGTMENHATKVTKIPKIWDEQDKHELKLGSFEFLEASDCTLV